MQWWNDLIDWSGSGRGWRIISDAVVPFVAIVVAGVIAAFIGRGATKRVVTLHEREAKNGAIAGIISAASKAASWGSLGHDERAYADHLADDADIQLRLLPVAGAAVAADWAQHEITDIKKSSSTFSAQADQSLTEFRDRILEWQSKPAKARKLFRYDLERWKFETPDPDADLISKQQQWNADQRNSPTPPRQDTATPAGSTAALNPTVTRVLPNREAAPHEPIAPTLPTVPEQVAESTRASTQATAGSDASPSTTSTTSNTPEPVSATASANTSEPSTPEDGATSDPVQEASAAPIGVGLPAVPASAHTNAAAATDPSTSAGTATPPWQRTSASAARAAAPTPAADSINSGDPVDSDADAIDDGSAPPAKPLTASELRRNATDD